MVEARAQRWMLGDDRPPRELKAREIERFRPNDGKDKLLEIGTAGGAITAGGTATATAAAAAAIVEEEEVVEE